MSYELFIGVTTWNSELFIGNCLDSIYRTTPGLDTRVAVFDNSSEDETQNIVRKYGAELVVGCMSQARAMNTLMERSAGKYTLLIHADVIFLSEDWFDLCRSKLSDRTVLVSPEDIGCGPYTRLFGKGMPESSFLFFETAGAKKCKIKRWYRRFRIPYYRREFDFYGEHVTHNIPDRLKSKDVSWYPMAVHVSMKREKPIYLPGFSVVHWRDSLGYLQYGLGNFYSIDGKITHYHNWYDRMDKDFNMDSQETVQANGEGVPKAYVKAYTEAFLYDYKRGVLGLPNIPQKSNV